MNELYESLDITTLLLTKVFEKMRDVKIELMRVTEVATALLEMGLQKDSDVNNLYHEILSSKNKTNISEKIFSMGFLSYFPEAENFRVKLINEVFNEINSDGGIGRFVGDRSRIPVCWKLLENLHLSGIQKNNAIKKIINWMQEEWSKDIVRGGLSYKCSGILLANTYYKEFDKKFIEICIKWLLQDQNDDGGWGPKKDAPVGSVPSDTGLALRALSNYQNEEIKEAINRGEKWLLNNKSNSGFWKEHPMEKPLIHILLYLNKKINKNESKFY